MRSANARGHKPDYKLVVIATSLIAVGLIVVYSVSPGMSMLSGVSEGYYISKQIIALILGIVAFLIMSRLPYKTLGKFVLPLAVVSLIAILAVKVVGQEINGAHRWLQIGGVSFQPVELAKFAVLIGIADLLSRRKQEGRLGDFHKTIKPIGLVMALIAISVGVLQSDFGSTVVMISMIAAMMFISGVPFGNLIKIGLVVLLVLAVLILPSSYRRSRVSTFFNPTADCQGAGYQSCQALIAVGSGGMFGLGLARSVQAYGYLPEAANDSIFAILAEKFGFFGVAIILMLFITFFIKLLKIIELAPDDFSQLMVVGVLAWFSIQAIINIGAMLGVLPLKGITLPFISYGGTSLLFVMGALGLVFQISKYSSLVGRARLNNENNASRWRQRGAHYATASRRS